MGTFDDLSEEDFITLQRHHKAIEEEFENLDLKSDDSPDIIRQKCRTFAIGNLETALKTIAGLVTAAEKETTQLAAAKAVISIAQGTTQKDDSDPLAELYKQITKENNIP